MADKTVVFAAVPAYYCPQCGMQMQYTGLPFREQMARGEFLLQHSYDYGSVSRCPNEKQTFRVTVQIVGAVLVST